MKKKRKNKFVSNYLEILDEWDYSLNKENPNNVSDGSNLKAHWICKNGHSWTDSVYHRIKEGRQCPFCNGSKILKGFNDLSTTHPSIASEFLRTKNTDFTIYEISKTTSKKVWWKCKRCGAEYLMAPRDRINGAKCPVCGKKNAIKGIDDLETKYPQIAKEWNYEKNGNLSPSDFKAHSNKTVWWKCPKGHEWQASINNRTGKENKGICPICSNKMIVKGINDLGT